jgi:hypothetical protein
MTYSPQQWAADDLTKNASDRMHIVNARRLMLMEHFL